MYLTKEMVFPMEQGKRAVLIKGKGEVQLESPKELKIRKSRCEIPVRMGTDSYAEIGFMGAFSYFCDHSKIRNVKEIGRFTSISSEFTAGLPQHAMSLITTSSFIVGKSKNNWFVPHIKDLLSHEEWLDGNIDFFRKNEEKRKEIVIGNDVWIGQGVTINTGVTVGDGAVIGAGAMVVKDVAPYSVVAGVPAKEIRKRFPDDVIRRLLEIKWWDYGPEILIGISPDITAGIEELEKRVKNTDAWKADYVEFIFEKKEIYMTAGEKRKLLYKL